MRCENCGCTLFSCQCPNGPTNQLVDTEPVIPDVTIRFHRTQWWNLPEEAKQAISHYCGPLYPDAKGVLTMVLSESRWREISKLIEAKE